MLARLCFVVKNDISYDIELLWVEIQSQNQKFNLLVSIAFRPLTQYLDSGMSLKVPLT